MTTTPTNINSIGIVPGKRGSGKTTYVKASFAACALPKILIVDTFDHPAYLDIPKVAIDKIPYWQPKTDKSIRRCVIDDFDEAFEVFSATLKDTFIVFEDATKYFEGSLPPYIKRLCIDSKQNNVNIVFMFHSLCDVPPKIFRYANYILLFKTLENPDQFKSKTPNFPEVLQAYNELKTAPDYQPRLILLT